MSRIQRPTIPCVTLAMMLVPVSLMSAQQPKEAPPAPVPAQITAAQKAFVSNAGVDAMALAAFRREGEPDKPYNRFYAAMKEWGRYELVTSPADADLVFEISFSAPVSGFEKLTSYSPQFGLAILDTKTHFVLWTLTEPVQGAYRKGTWDKNFNQGLATLMDGLRKLAAPLATTAADAKK